MVQLFKMTTMKKLHINNYQASPTIVQSILVSVPATGSTGFDSRFGASPPGGLRGGRSLCEYLSNKVIQKNIRPRLAVSKKINNYQATFTIDRNRFQFFISSNIYCVHHVILWLLANRISSVSEFIFSGKFFRSEMYISWEYADS